MENAPRLCLTQLPAVERRALGRIDHGTRTGSGSRVAVLSVPTRQACAALFASGLVRIYTARDGTSWYQTTEKGRALLTAG